MDILGWYLAELIPSILLHSSAVLWKQVWLWKPGSSRTWKRILQLTAVEGFYSHFKMSPNICFIFTIYYMPRDAPLTLKRFYLFLGLLTISFCIIYESNLSVKEDQKKKNELLQIFNRCTKYLMLSLMGLRWMHGS